MIHSLYCEVRRAIREGVNDKSKRHQAIRTIFDDVVEAAPALHAGAQAIELAGPRHEALAPAPLHALGVAPAPARPGVPAAEQLAPGHLAGLGDAGRAHTLAGPQALAGPRSDAVAAGHGARRPVGPAGPLARELLAARAARLGVAGASLRALARARVAGLHLSRE